MPIYRVEGPDGRIHRFEGPPNATPEEVEAFAQQQFGQPKRGFGAAFSKGVEGILSSGQTALGSLFGDPNEAARQALQRSEEQQNKYAEQVGTERVKQAYEKKGLAGAAGEVARQVPLALAEQAPQLGTSLGSGFAGARLGAMAGLGTRSPMPSSDSVDAGWADVFQARMTFGTDLQRAACHQGIQLDIHRGA